MDSSRAAPQYQWFTACPTSTPSDLPKTHTSHGKLKPAGSVRGKVTQTERRSRLVGDRYTANCVCKNTYTQKHRGRGQKEVLEIINTPLKQDTHMRKG